MIDAKVLKRLDWSTGSGLFSVYMSVGMPSLGRLETLKASRLCVSLAIDEDVCWTSSDLKRVAQEALTAARGELPTVLFEILSVLGSHKAPVAQRKIRDAIDKEIFRARQMELPYKEIT